MQRLTQAHVVGQNHPPAVVGRLLKQMLKTGHALTLVIEESDILAQCLRECWKRWTSLQNTPTRLFIINPLNVAFEDKPLFLAFTGRPFDLGRIKGCLAGIAQYFGEGLQNSLGFAHRDRLWKALDLEGGLTTGLGFLKLGFKQFPYLRGQRDNHRLAGAFRQK